MAAALGLLLLIVVLLAGTVPSIFGYESYVVYSGSMEPAIGVGDLAVVGPIKPDQLAQGDIITYRTPERPEVVVTHRLIDITREEKGGLTFQTKGDANQSVDRVGVDQGAVLGKVSYTIPKLGYLVDFSKKPEGRVLLIGIPGLLLALDYLLGRGNRKNRETSTSRAAVDLVRKGHAALAAGGPEAALSYFDQAIALDPHFDEAWLLKADCIPDSAERQACLRAALTINPASARLKQAVEAAT